MFVALRDLRFAKGRFALMGTVVFLITLLVTMLSGLTAGLARENVSAVENLPADHLVFDSGEKAAFADSRITERTWKGWEQVKGVTAERLGVSMSRLAYGDEQSAGVALFGVQPGGDLAQGQPVDTGKVVLSAALAADTAVKTGDTVQLAGKDLTVAGIGGEASYSHTPVAWISIGDWEWMGRQGGAGTVATTLALRTGGAPDLVAADAKLGTTTVSLSEAPAAIGSFSSENGSLQLMRGFLFAISALVIGAFFTVWTIQRRGDVAVLKALGASSGYLLRDALAQAIIVLLAGAGIGGALGAGLGALAEGTVPFVLSATTTVVPVAVMILLGAAGAALAIRKITSVDPLTALGASR
ncbi:ABC transporter permease [Streptosporangium sp. NBC_01756]|uniref:ABC transporter permease n=1 Tax=Streptosporangium sp. NBC_01756 TaxID=2975950 RepID=UPI002DD96D7D|nr:FtsX-like permease family protein [Streptosporangium sp. NBC_01756]WSC87167.1 ABC transporter permease [Streptosporangium sp. NBC_01756]